MSLLLSDEARASDLLSEVVDAYQSIQMVPKLLTLGDFVGYFMDWTRAREIAAKHAIELPDGNLDVSTSLMAQHGDLHPENILVVDNRPILIDFDDSCNAPKTMDPATALLSPFFHKESNLRNEPWPALEDSEIPLGAHSLANSPIPDWTTKCIAWLAPEGMHREQWAAVLGYSLRQLKYQDVYENPTVSDRAVSLAKSACCALLS